MTIAKLFRIGSTIGVIMASAAIASSEPQPPQPIKPPIKAIQPLLKKKIGPAIVQAVGVLSSECDGAKAALQAYNACKDRCAQKADDAPVSVAELDDCGDLSASECADQIVAKRANACITAPAPAGCSDEFRTLQRENFECKSCKDLAAPTEAARKDLIEASREVARAQAALNRARAIQHAKLHRYQAIAARKARACAAAKK